MNTTKWFDRKFDFPISMNQYAVLLEQLQQAPGIYRQTVVLLPQIMLQLKPSGKWSVKEHIGHLLQLEPLWRARFTEIKDGKPIMAQAILWLLSEKSSYSTGTFIGVCGGR